MARADTPLQAQLLKVPVIVGPTGIGKSKVAFELAQELGGEVVVADSRQVYQRLDIATNKPSPEQRRAVRYHMIDFVDPATSFNAAQYVAGARAAIDDIASRGRVPIVADSFGPIWIPGHVLSERAKVRPPYIPWCCARGCR